MLCKQWSLQFFWVLLFPHEGRIVTIDQLSFSHPDPSSGASTVPMIDNPQPDIVNIGVGLCPPLMGTFDYPPPSDDVKFISDQPKVEIFQVSSFRTTYFNDPVDSSFPIGHDGRDRAPWYGHALVHGQKLCTQ
jgi:hypothetical protein